MWWAAEVYDGTGGVGVVLSMQRQARAELEVDGWILDREDKGYEFRSGCKGLFEVE